MAFPAAGAPSNTANTHGVQKQIYEDWLAATKELPGAADEAAATIASGSITVASSLIKADTEGSLSADDLDYILTAEGSELRVIVLRATDAGRVITVRHGQGGIGQILLRDSANAVLDAVAKSLVLVLRGTDWVEVARSWLPAASETAAGITELATQAEFNAGTDDIRAVTSLKARVGTLALLNAGGTAPVYACRAWVNFNGTGTVAIRASGNVSSITDNGTGDYTVNFSTALPDSNYAAVVTVNGTTYGAPIGPGGANGLVAGTTTLRIVTVQTSTNIADADKINVAIFR